VCPLLPASPVRPQRETATDLVTDLLSTVKVFGRDEQFAADDDVQADLDDDRHEEEQRKLHQLEYRLAD